MLGLNRRRSFERRFRISPPSAKLVAIVLKHNGTLSQRGITAESLLPERTVRLGLDKLQTVEVVDVRTSLRDARKRHYTLSLESTAETGQ
jgi:hypothetical protein